MVAHFSPQTGAAVNNNFLVFGHQPGDFVEENEAVWVRLNTLKWSQTA
jgi:hypothetical protein